MDNKEHLKKIKISHKTSTFLVFVLLSAFLWLIIKLSDTYTIQSSFKIFYSNIPVEKFMPNNSGIDKKITITSSGFKLLRYYLIRQSKRSVFIALNEIPYRQENNSSTYSYSGQYICHAISDKINLPANSVTISDNTIYFQLDNLKSKEISVTLVKKLGFKKQYNLYTQPTLSPQKITVYGSENVIDTLKTIYTENLVLNDIDHDINTTVKLNLLQNQIKSDIDEVQVNLNIELFTEANIKVPLIAPKKPSIRLFPEKVNVKCMVPLKDYRSLNSNSFVINIDSKDIEQNAAYLRYKLMQKPANVQIIKIEPEEIEYLIIEH